MVRKSVSNKAQSGSNAAVVIIIIMVLITLYILFLPPEDREDLLSGGTGTGGNSGGTSGGTVRLDNARPAILLRESIGKIYSQDDDEDQFKMNSFTISTETQGGIVKTKSSIYTKSSAFQEQTDSMIFSIDEDLTDNLILSFNVRRGSGRLTITLNGVTVYTGEIDQGNSPPIYLDEDQIQGNNDLTFSVSGPGIAFWRFNEYDLTDIKITGDITDISGSQNIQSLALRSRDLSNLESSRLRFLAECNERQVQNFEVRLNGQRLFRGIPDCAIYNFLPIDSSSLLVGNNEFEFSIQSGRVLVDRLELQNKLEDPDYPVMYFEMHEDYFVDKKEDAFCGKVDGICPRGCEEDEDVDCCFDRRDNFWCDIETPNLNDRCVSFVNDCERCPAGYEDYRGDPPDKCVEGIGTTDPPAYCGDDTDDVCPSGCSPLYDQDCCYEAYPEGYWCDDQPEAGMTSICEQSIELVECDDCVNGYDDIDGHAPDCRGYKPDTDDDEEELDPDFEVTLKFVFPNDDDRKKMEIFINGRIIGINTVREEYERDISDYVRSGTNSIELRPDKDLTITELRVTVR